MAALANDQFDSVMGSARGSDRGPVPVPDCYAALTDADLAYLAGLLADDPMVAAQLTVGRTEPETLLLIGLDSWDRLEGLHYMRLLDTHTEAERAREPLRAKVNACVRHLLNIEDAKWTVAGARKFAMYTLAGDLAVTKLVDSLAGLDSAEAHAALQAGRRQVAARHAEVYDTDVRECLYAELERLGYDAARLME